MKILHVMEGVGYKLEVEDNCSVSSSEPLARQSLWFRESYAKFIIGALPMIVFQKKKKKEQYINARKHNLNQNKL